ncbi:NAD(P)-dependent alcohol dehydrogenase [Agathobacter sp.]
MKAVVYTKTGGLEVVKQQSVETPLPGDDQVMIEVKACALNVSDYQRFQTNHGKIPVSTYITNKMMGYVGKPLGAEIAGIVTKTGKNVTHVKAGDAVFGKTAGTAPVGGIAEYAVMDADRVCLKPDNFSFEEAATVSISFDTALGAVRKANIKPGQKVMIYGASGGVGLFAVQLAKVAGAEVTGVCSTRNIEVAKSAGCDGVIDYKKDDFTKTDTKYDAIIGINGCNPMKKYKSIMKENGIFVGVGDVSQAMKALMASFASRNFTYYAGAFTKQDDYLQYAKKLTEAGKLHTYIDKVYSVNETVDAIQYLLTSHASGKVVIKTDF